MCVTRENWWVFAQWRQWLPHHGNGVNVLYSFTHETVVPGNNKPLSVSHKSLTSEFSNGGTFYSHCRRNSTLSESRLQRAQTVRCKSVFIVTNTSNIPVNDIDTRTSARYSPILTVTELYKSSDVKMQAGLIAYSHCTGHHPNCLLPVHGALRKDKGYNQRWKDMWV